MASNTRKLKVRRALAKAGAGKKRKRADRNQGSTAANLPLDKPTANEVALKKAAAAKK